VYHEENDKLIEVLPETSVHFFPNTDPWAVNLKGTFWVFFLWYMHLCRFVLKNEKFKENIKLTMKIIFLLKNVNVYKIALPHLWIPVSDAGFYNDKMRFFITNFFASFAYITAGFLPGFLWQVRIKAKVAEFTHSSRNLWRSFLPRGVARGAEPPSQRKFWDSGSRI